MKDLENCLFLLEKMKGHFCMTAKGEVYKMLSWEISDKKEVLIQSLFGVKKTVQEKRLLLLKTRWSKHVGTDYVSIFDFSKKADQEITDNITAHYENRQRFIKMTAEIDVFGLHLVAAPPIEAEEDLIKRQIGL